MSLIRQIWLLLLATLLLAFMASAAVNVSSARATLETELRLKNSDNATVLAQVLSQQKGQLGLMELAAAAQFDTGYYRRIRFTSTDGRVLFEREASASPHQAPAWFAALWPIETVPGVAQVSDGWRALGALEVLSQSAYVHDELWQASLRVAWALFVVGLAAALLAWIGVRRIRLPLDHTVEQAASLQRGEYLTLPEPQIPELRRLTRAMNSMVARLRVVFEGQAAQVESLRRQANCDAPTGLANRSHFMAQLSANFQREDGQIAGGLVLLRLLRLAEVNRVHGRERTDRLIAGVARVLQAYVEGSPGALLGRLNGSDFAFTLSESGTAVDNARAVVDLLRASFRDADVAVAAGVVETRRHAPLAGLMSAADLALARAETAGPFSVESADALGAEWSHLGERGWRERLLSALLDGRAQLAQFPVLNSAEQLIHWECPLRLRLEPDGPFEVAAHWLPLAIRSCLTCEVDERALALALDAIARDGQARGVNLSPDSLTDSGFASRLRKQLQAAPRAARHVWLEVHESAAAAHFDWVRELARQVRPCGARFGLEHAGERISQMERLFEAGLDYVKLDVAVTEGVAEDSHRAGFVKGLATMLHSLSIQVIAEGVKDASTAQTLWAMGVDGMTGPGVEMPAQNAAP